jgi:hypothetical protein
VCKPSPVKGDGSSADASAGFDISLLETVGYPALKTSLRESSDWLSRSQAEARLHPLAAEARMRRTICMTWVFPPPKGIIPKGGATPPRCTIAENPCLGCVCLRVVAWIHSGW